MSRQVMANLIQASLIHVHIFNPGETNRGTRRIGSVRGRAPGLVGVPAPKYRDKCVLVFDGLCQGCYQAL